MTQVEEIEIEPEVEPVEADDVAVEPEVEPAEPPPAATARSLPVPLMEVLPADFKLPDLIRFVPDVTLRVRAERAAAAALGVAVTGAAGLEQADTALTEVRLAQKEIEAHFEEPTGTANALHKRLTTLRSEWLARGNDAVSVVGRRIWSEQQRLSAIAAEERRRVQAEADRQAREAAEREAEAARAAQAPPEVVEELQQQAKTITAPPVAPTASAPPKLAGSTPITTWKGRIKGSPAEADPNPDIEALTPAQRVEVFHLLRGILEGTDPIAAIQINWSYVNKRAKADKGTLKMSGIEAFADGGNRAKASRSRA